MSSHLSGKRVLVTAAASGIGKVVVERFLADGAVVHICDLDSIALEQFAISAKDLGGSQYSCGVKESIHNMNGPCS